MSDDPYTCACRHDALVHLPTREGDTAGACMQPGCSCKRFTKRSPTVNTA